MSIFYKTRLTLLGIFIAQPSKPQFYTGVYYPLKHQMYGEAQVSYFTKTCALLLEV